MEKKPSISRNFIYNMFYQILLILTPLIVSPYISRVLGSEHIGIYSYTYSIAHYFGLFCLLGINNHGSRTIAVCRDDEEQLERTFSEIYSLQVYISIIVLIAYVFFVIMFADKKLMIFFAIQFFYVLSYAIDITWFYSGLEEFKITITRKVIIKILTILSIFTFVRKNKDIVLYTLIMSTTYFISEIYLWFFVRRRVNFRFVSITQTLKHFKHVLLLFIPILAVSIYRMMDKIMLGKMDTMYSVGQYENADKIIMVCLSVASALGAVMLPRIAKLNADNNTSAINYYIKNCMNFMMFFSCAVTFGLGAVGHDFALFFFGVEFNQCGKIIQILSPSVIFIALSNVIRTQYLIPCLKDKIYIIAVAIGAILNFIMNYFMIPIYGGIGAAIATVATECIVCLIQVVYAEKTIRLLSLVKGSVVYLLFGLIMFIIVEYINHVLPFNVTSLFIRILVGAAIYLTLSLIYAMLFNKASIINLKKMIQRIFN